MTSTEEKPPLELGRSTSLEKLVVPDDVPIPIRIGGLSAISNPDLTQNVIDDQIDLRNIPVKIDTSAIDRKASTLNALYQVDESFWGIPADESDKPWYSHYSRSKDARENVLSKDYLRAFALGMDQEPFVLLQIASNHLRQAGIDDTKQIHETLIELFRCFDGGWRFADAYIKDRSVDPASFISLFRSPEETPRLNEAELSRLRDAVAVVVGERFYKDSFLGLPEKAGDLENYRWYYVYRDANLTSFRKIFDLYRDAFALGMRDCHAPSSLTSELIEEVSRRMMAAQSSEKVLELLGLSNASDENGISRLKASVQPHFFRWEPRRGNLKEALERLGRVIAVEHSLGTFEEIMEAYASGLWEKSRMAEYPQLYQQDKDSKKPLLLEEVFPQLRGAGRQLPPPSNNQ